MNVWLLTWEGTTGQAVCPAEKVIAILSSRRSSKFVIGLVQTIYHANVDTAHEMLRTVNRVREREQCCRHPCSTDWRYFYGRNPWIFARKVVNLTIQKDERRACEVICWMEEAVLVNATCGSGLEVKWPSRQCEHIRPLVPLAGNGGSGGLIDRNY